MKIGDILVFLLYFMLTSSVFFVLEAEEALRLAFRIFHCISFHVLFVFFWCSPFFLSCACTSSCCLWLLTWEINQSLVFCFVTYSSSYDTSMFWWGFQVWLLNFVNHTKYVMLTLSVELTLCVCCWEVDTFLFLPSWPVFPGI